VADQPSSQPGALEQVEHRRLHAQARRREVEAAQLQVAVAPDDQILAR
jgi:hypothetical protein